MSFYCCYQINCNKKYKKEEKLKAHILKEHRLRDNATTQTSLCQQASSPAMEVEAPIPEKVNLMYLCTEINCKRKYRESHRLGNHLLMDHNIIINPEDLAKLTPVDINSSFNDANRIVKNKDDLKKQKIDEINNKKQLEVIAKNEAEIIYKNELMERYRQIELDKIEYERLQINIKKKEQEFNLKWLKIANVIQENLLKNSELCCICFENPIDSAPIPCGHLNYCYECIFNYSKDFSHKGCPLCKQQIKSVNKIYL